MILTECGRSRARRPSLSRVRWPHPTGARRPGAIEGPKYVDCCNFIRVFATEVMVRAQVSWTHQAEMRKHRCLPRPLLLGTCPLGGESQSRLASRGEMKW